MVESPTTGSLEGAVHRATGDGDISRVAEVALDSHELNVTLVSQLGNYWRTIPPGTRFVHHSRGFGRTQESDHCLISPRFMIPRHFSHSDLIYWYKSPVYFCIL